MNVTASKKGSKNIMLLSRKGLEVTRYVAHCMSEPRDSAVTLLLSIFSSMMELAMMEPADENDQIVTY